MHFPTQTLQINADIILERDVDIPMRDGAILKADVFRPAKAGQYPAIMNLGPYQKEKLWVTPPDLEEPPNEHMNWETVNPLWWVPKGYIAIRVDARGSGHSPGQYDPWSLAEAVDFYDAIEWAAKQPWSNGNVGLNGKPGGEYNGQWWKGTYGWNFTIFDGELEQIAHRNSFTFLFFALMSIFIFQGWLLASTFLIQGSVVALLISGTMAIQSIRYSDKQLSWICVSGTVAVVANWLWWAVLPMLPESARYGARGAGLLILAMVLAVLIGAMVYHLWHNDYTGRNALFCAASSYLLIGFLWSCFFSLISYFEPNAFSDNVAGTSIKMEGREIHESFHRFFYFSMITITTVGYGDMTPVAPLARHLAWIEAAIGQFYFALILTRLVSSQFVQSVERISNSKDSETPPGEMEENGIIQAINPASGYQSESK